MIKPKKLTGLLGKDLKDKRDYLLSSAQPVGVALPDTFMLKDEQSPVQDQNGYGICYAMAGTGIAEYWNSKEYNHFINLSERFVAHYTKVISGQWDTQGDYFKNAVKAICDYGLCLETEWKNDFSLSWNDFIKIEPPIDIIEKAKEFKGKTYWRVDASVENIKQAIFQNKTPVLIGMNWFNSYFSTPIDGQLPLPSGKQSGHAVICVGWDMDNLWFKNSWSSNWGNQGYFYIPINEWDKHDIWDVWILLDLPRKDMRLPLRQLVGQRDVWIIGMDNKRHLILNIETFNRGKEMGLWGDFADIEKVDALPEKEGSVIALFNSD